MTVVLSLGSNLGDRLAHLQLGLDTLALRGARVSPVYETDPVGPAQPDFLNAVVVGDPPADLLDLVRAAEAAARRERRERWGPRTLDVDVVAVGDRRSEDPALTLPHPRAHERAFVLVPWLDVDPAAVLPGHGAVADLVAAMDTSGVRRRDDLTLRA